MNKNVREFHLTESFSGNLPGVHWLHILCMLMYAKQALLFPGDNRRGIRLTLWGWLFTLSSKIRFFHVPFLSHLSYSFPFGFFKHNTFKILPFFNILIQLFSTLHRFYAPGPRTVPWKQQTPVVQLHQSPVVSSVIWILLGYKLCFITSNKLSLSSDFIYYHYTATICIS